MSIKNFLVTHSGVSDDLAYAMTKALFDNLDQLKAAHAAAKGISKQDAAANPPAPLHPGAARYYREAGLVK